MERLAVFGLSEPTEIPAERLTRLSLRQAEPGIDGVALTDRGICFTNQGWFEVLLRVAWDAHEDAGVRFSHTAIPDQHPLHSEAIDAAVLNRISGGEQLLRGNTWFGTEGHDTINLEVWHSSSGPVRILDASLGVRALLPAVGSARE